MIHQSVNMRSATPINFGDSDSRLKYEREVAAAMRSQRVRFAVAPRIRLRLPNGTGFIEAGGEVTPALLSGGPLAGEAVLRNAIESGHVIEADITPPGPEAA